MAELVPLAEAVPLLAAVVRTRGAASAPDKVKSAAATVTVQIVFPPTVAKLSPPGRVLEPLVPGKIMVYCPACGAMFCRPSKPARSAVKSAREESA